MAARKERATRIIDGYAVVFYVESGWMVNGERSRLRAEGVGYCPSCSHVKPLNEMRRSGSSCLACHSALTKEYRDGNTEKNSKLTEKQVFDHSFKQCSGCGLHKKRTKANWSKKADCADGLNDYCKSCRSEIVKNGRKKYKRRNKNRDPYDGTAKVCPGCYEELPRTSEHWHRGASNPDGLNAYCVSCHAIRKANRREVDKNGDLTIRQVQKLWALQGGECHYCGVELEIDGDHHLDHIVPISKGGKSTITNVVHTCVTCNTSKGAKDVEEWADERGISLKPHPWKGEKS